MLQRLWQLFRPDTDPQKFALEVAQTFRERIPQATVELLGPSELRVTPPGADAQSVFLDNLYLTCVKSWRRRGPIIARFVDSLAEIELDHFLPKDIIPIIKDTPWVTEVETAMQAKGAEMRATVTEAYNNELSILYAVNQANSIRYLTPEELTEVNLQGESLRNFAVRNLQEILPNVVLETHGPIRRLQAGGMFEASLILLDRVWNKKELEIKGDIVIAIPSRELLLVADSNDPQALATIRKAATGLARDAAYRLTDQLFIRRDGTFQPLPKP
jgi:uncharacterized protein YtpQ (UPF0354 family)